MWVLFTLLAVCSQLMRNVFSKKLGKELSPITVSLSRFLFGIPIVSIVFFSVRSIWGSAEIISNEFYFWMLVFAITQASGNALLVFLLGEKNFAVVITYVQTETVFASILAMGLLGEKLHILGWLGVFLAFIGLSLTTFSKEKISMSAFKSSFSQRGAYIGLLVGLLFACAAITIKRTFLYVEADSVFVRSSFCLISALFIQTTLLSTYIIIRKPREFIYIITKPKIPMILGSFSAMGSLFWFLAFSLSYIAYVKTVAQAEFILGILISSYHFKEKIYKNEYLGMAMIVLGTLMLILIN